MSKWDQRYQSATQPNSTAQVLTDNIHLLPAKGNALELACGLGGNALLLAKQGLSVDALDSSAVAIAKLAEFSEPQLQLTPKCIDLEHHQLPDNHYDVICVSAYLSRTFCPQITQALASNGLLFYQTFTQVKALPSGPNNPDFLLEPGELLQLFKELQVIAYREENDCGDLQQGLRNQAYLVARKTPA